MPPKKRSVRSAFFYFMQDFRQEKQSKGHVFEGGFEEVQEEAGLVWDTMSPEDKDYYFKLVSKAKKQYQEEKLTSIGITYADLHAKEKEDEDSLQLMIEAVKNMVRSLSRRDSLPKELFYLCHVNYFYKTEKGIYFPAEIAMAEFSLEEGITNTFHTFLDIGKLELGFRFEATTWSQKTHNIPIDDPNWTLGENDYYFLYSRVISFLKKRGDAIPPIFTMPDSYNNNTSIGAVKYLFSRLAAAGGEVDLFTIYPLPQLFYELRNHCVDDTVVDESEFECKYLPTVALAENELEKDIFAYARNLGCAFHEEKDLGIFCSLSIVTRWVFSICDHCCSLLGIELIQGCHCPMDADTNRVPNSTFYTDNVEFEDKKGKDQSSKLTIIDHGKLKEQTAQGGSQHSIDDVRLPKKVMYSTAAKNKASHPAPLLNSSNFPEMGKGMVRKIATGEFPLPNWPASGRGSKLL